MLTFDMAATLAILAGAVILLVTEVIRNDVIGILIVLALTFSGAYSRCRNRFQGSQPTVLIISCMFIVSKAILHTGVAQRVDDFIIRRGGRNEKRLLTMIMGASASVGAFMSSTATAAIFIPITLAVAEKPASIPNACSCPWLSPPL